MKAESVCAVTEGVLHYLLNNKKDTILICIEYLTDWGPQGEALNKNQAFLCAGTEDAERTLVV